MTPEGSRLRQGELPLFGGGADRPREPDARTLHDQRSFLDLSSFATLEELTSFALGCRRCGLREGCRGVVFGEGDPHARVMLVGEGPGAREDELGRPFVGAAGQLLDRILAAVGFAREEVYITNTVMCRPPGNRTPTWEEMEVCRPWLVRKIELIRPKILVTLGRPAAQVFLGKDVSITRVRGRWHRWEGIDVMPTFHPAALLRDPSKKRAVWEDFQEIQRRYADLSRAPEQSHLFGE